MIRPDSLLKPTRHARRDGQRRPWSGGPGRRLQNGLRAAGCWNVWFHSKWSSSPLNSETKAVLCFYLFIYFLQREVLAWGRLLANHRSSEVQVLLPR